MDTCVLDVIPPALALKRIAFDKDKSGFAVVMKKKGPWTTVGTGKDKSQVLVPMFPISAELLCSIGDCVRLAEKEGLKSCVLVVEKESGKLGFVAV